MRFFTEFTLSQKARPFPGLVLLNEIGTGASLRPYD